MEPRLHPVIAAGGRGTRLWPLSRRSRPKPFLSLDGGPTLLAMAWNRALRLAPAADVLVAVEGRLATQVREALPDLPTGNLLLEPQARDTGPAAAHAAWRVEAIDPGGGMVFLPADHLVADEERFADAIRVAWDAARREHGLLCIGVTPGGPSTAYGYIECEGSLPGTAGLAKVARFVEKPDAERAARLLASGRCLWNAGIFVWRAADLLAEAEAVSPELAPALRRLRREGDAGRFFAEAPSLAVDRAILERSRRAWVVEAEMGWDDLGGWEAVVRHLPADADANCGPGRRVAVDSRGCLVHTGGKPVVLLGVEDLVIVDCDDVLFVARRDQAERTREVPAALTAAGLEDRT
jgi:mannose-1-phosphate guanylyltransferase/mannose-6-phosphate isomerase